ncbi:MAG TPA: hypothetical protein VMY98_02235 [Anaerolineae bacterium]|nr:hypothetical protein [Anaerolineae bacterium]
MSEWIDLSNDPNSAVKGQYKNIQDGDAPHWLRDWVYCDVPTGLNDEGALEFTTAELANIPIVKALVEACRCAPLASIAHRMDVEGGGGDCVRQILDALLPFEEREQCTSE